jgi:hypothetical protein
VAEFDIWVETRASAIAVASIESFVTIALFSGVGLLLSLSVLILDQYIPGEGFESSLASRERKNPPGVNRAYLFVTLFSLKSPPIAGAAAGRLHAVARRMTDIAPAKFERTTGPHCGRRPTPTIIRSTRGSTLSARR